MGDIPAPLVPEYVDLRNLPTMPLDVRVLRDSRLATMATGEEFQAAVLLWAASWHQIPAGSLPTDDRELALLSGFGRAAAEFRRISAGSLSGWVKCSDNRLYHPFIAKLAIDAWEYRKKYEYSKACDRNRKENAAKVKSNQSHMQVSMPSFEDWISAGKFASVGGIPAENALKERKGKERKGSSIKTFTSLRSDPSTIDATVTPNTPEPANAGKESAQGGDKASNPGQTPSQEKAARGTRLPAGWTPTYSDVQSALELQATWNSDHVDAVAADFRDYWIAVPGMRGLKLDWSATWRSWVRKAKPQFRGANNERKTIHDKRRDTLDRLTGNSQNDAIDGQSRQVD